MSLGQNVICNLFVMAKLQVVEFHSVFLFFLAVSCTKMKERERGREKEREREREVEG